VAGKAALGRGPAAWSRQIATARTHNRPSKVILRSAAGSREADNKKRRSEDLRRSAVALPGSEGHTASAEQVAELVGVLVLVVRLLDHAEVEGADIVGLVADVLGCVVHRQGGANRGDAQKRQGQREGSPLPPATAAIALPSSSMLAVRSLIVRVAIVSSPGFVEFEVLRRSARRAWRLERGDCRARASSCIKRVLDS